MGAQEATAQLDGKSIAYKNELLFSRGINFDKLPAWQKRGIGVFFADVEKVGFNPITKQEVLTTRRELTVEYDLPLGQQYGDMVASFLE